MSTTPNDTRTTIAAALYPALLLMPTPPAWAAHSQEWREQCAAEAVMCADALLAALSASQPAEHPKEATCEDVAELLYSLGWNSQTDAQWHKLRDALPRLRDMLCGQVANQPAQSPPATAYAPERPLHEIIDQMRWKGGNFVQKLSDLIVAADAENQSRLLAAFPEIFERYDALASMEGNTKDQEREASSASDCSETE